MSETWRPKQDNILDMNTDSYSLRKYHNGTKLQESQTPTARKARKGNVVQSQPNGGNDGSNGDGRNVFQKDRSHSGKANDHLDESRHNDGSLNDTHSLLKAIAWIRNGLQIRVCDNGKRRG
jgi:hypothetical protein